MRLYKNTKEMVRTFDGDTDFFDILAGILPEYLFLICLDYVLRTSTVLLKENGFYIKKGQETDDIP